MVSGKTFPWIEIFSHLIFWVGMILLFVLPQSQQTIMSERIGQPEQVITLGNVYWITYSVSAILFYMNILVLFPYFSKTRRYLLYVIGLVSLSGIIIFFERSFLLTNFGQLGNSLFLSSILNHSIFLLFSLIYILIKQHIRLIQKTRFAEMERLSNELQFLKSQLNPHFLFNAINNIFSIAQKNEDEEVARHLTDLSKTLRYSLYESHEKEVPLSKELEFLDSFIQMSLLKYAPNQINLKYENNVTTDKRVIAPLLLIPLVENAFKHSSGTKIKKITILLDLNGEHLTLFVSNNHKQQVTTNLPTTGGIGLKNLKRRLELLYPEKYDFWTNATDDMFEAKLSIQLDGA